MKRPAPSRSNRRAFLLIEAGLAAVAIAVGLAMITRGIAGSLAAVARLQAYDQLLGASQSLLTTLQVGAQRHPPLARREGTCEEFRDRCEWTLSSAPAELPASGVPPEAFSAVTLTVRDASAHGAVVRLTTFWPREWVAE